MAKCVITDWRWIGPAFFCGWFGGACGIVLFGFAWSVRPFPTVVSWVAYCGIIGGLTIAVVRIFLKGFVYRRAKVTEEGVTIQEGWYCLLWKARHIPKERIRALEQYSYSRETKGIFAGGWVRVLSGLRLLLDDGSSIVLTETDGADKLSRQAAEMRQILGIR